MLKSMTAFAGAERSENNHGVNIEIRAYNSRYLDISLRLPHAYQRIEDRIKALVTRRIERGRIEISIQIREAGDAECRIEMDDAKIRAYQSAVRQLRDDFHIEGSPSMDFLLGPGGVIRLVEPDRDIESVWSVLEQCMEEALHSVEQMRMQEGAAIEKDFDLRLKGIEGCLDRIESTGADLLPYYQERLRDRIAALTDGMIDIDPARIAQEAAYYADRSDISEEIVRARSHLEQFRAIIRSDETAGRKLNFLLQELSREFNTMGSKVGHAGASHIIVSVKSELEKIREQVQNVE